MPISDWPLQQRPRERLIRLGPQALSDAELLAVFLRIGIPGKTAVELGQDMVAHFGSLNKIFSAPLPEFLSLRGLGPAKFAQLHAVFELAKRALGEGLQEAPMLDSPQNVRHYLRLQFAAQAVESFVVMFLDVRNRLIASEELFRGTLTHAGVYPREVVKKALSHNAASVILAHNHPSGDARPSTSDHSLTNILLQALTLVEVRLLDHFVIGTSSIYSFAENGHL
jgi:DNA repair protein RadC